MADTNIVILSAVRTPIGKFCGGLGDMKASDLGSIVIKEALDRAKIPPKDVSEVILGQVLTAGQGQNPARQAAVGADLPYEVPASLVNMLCGSGLKSVALGYQAIKLGEADVVVCGGQESMTQAHHAVKLRQKSMGNMDMVDTMLIDGLVDAFHNYHMGITAENVAKRWNISRDEQDRFAVFSQRKTADAQKDQCFKEELVPVLNLKVPLQADEFPRNDTSLEGLKKLKPCFLKDGTGTVTPGNASGLNDGAAALVLTTEKEAKARELKPLARIMAWAQTGVDPAVMGIGPVSAVKKVLSKVGWSVEDVDLWELNEAFAAQSLAVLRELGLDKDKVNVNGGAIALGHPIGASGARILVTLLHAMKRLEKKRGVAALCVGGGMGIALCVERS
ncbi:acetyl-CoA acetyltransferase, cytosolic-like [Penaeus indicus]|uniref:acetyl-CoA acetyltransferase, cytosolic-like n=1 Tax=Penaeus indicus TaxID=29960 RepID=UPI00300D113D